MKTKVNCCKHMVKCITVELCERLRVNLEHMWYEREILQNLMALVKVYNSKATIIGLVMVDSNTNVETKLGVFE